MTSPGYEVVTTRDGAKAMLDRSCGEVMHPKIGPLREAEHLYVRSSRLADRLAGCTGRTLTVFDVGLGAGSNAIAAWRLSEARTRADSTLEIVSFDRTIAALELALATEHADAFGFDAPGRRAARALVEHGEHVTDKTRWRLILGELPGSLTRPSCGSADIVFWDPFSPRANPHLWTTSTFATLKTVCAQGATLHTYSVATSTRSAMLLAGFAVGAGSATGDKAETTTAALDHADLARPLGHRWLQRLRRSSAPLPDDAPLDAISRIAAAAQFA